MSISSGPDQTYQNPDAGGKGTSAEKFVSISERNGDLAYNKEDYPLNYTQRICAATNIAAIDLVCQTKAWDRDHPAGTSLNDITKIETYTYAPYVRQGYQGWYPIQIFKFLAVLEPTELSMIEPSFYLYIGGSPAPDTYLIEIRIKTTEGETQTVIYPLTVNS